MKKIFIFLVMFGAYCSSFAFTTQSNWRWRNNDGTETTATWKAAQNTAITYGSVLDTLRLRVEVYSTLTSATEILDSLQYTTTPLVSTSWVNVTNDQANAFVLAGTNAFVTQNEPTTSQITGNPFPFDAGEIMVSERYTKDVFIQPSHRSEYEWVIKGTDNTLPNTVYFFRHWGSSSNTLPPGVTYPSLTTGAVLPVKLSSFNVKNDGKQVKLEWTTATEQNNDRFDVQRSANGTTWQTITQVKGKGTSSNTNHYVAYDISPLLGTNYYRLQQVDLNGRTVTSEVKLLRLNGVNRPMVYVSPNPSKGAINFVIESQPASNVVATLTDANGKMIHQEKFKNVPANTMNKLNLKQSPIAGMYILKLSADGISESLKIIVQ